MKKEEPITADEALFPTCSEPKKKLPLFAKIFFILGASSLLLYIIFLISPAFSDFFNRNISSVFRGITAHISNIVPFSLAELLLLISPVVLVFLVAIGIKKYSSTWHDVLIYCLCILSAIALIFSIFSIGFAAGYRGRPLDEKLGLERRDVSAEELYATADILCTLIWSEMDNIVYDPEGRSVMPYDLSVMNEKLIESYDKASTVYSFIPRLNSRVKPVMLSEPMSYTHITGVYTFFTGEANINIAFPDYTLPYTAAHELSHQRGFAPEDEANFMAFLVPCLSDDSYIRYSAYLNLYEYVSNALYSADQQLYLRSFARLPEAVKGELRAYAEFASKYEDSTIGEISGAVNNAFLIVNGTEGTKSYGMVVDLAVAFFRPFFSE
ncbi:MAG: DUF3810 domain-containing protein [Clostridia bacterium]|nr:DUF3810 domain-containing protein [Clostridia bacterium]